MEDMNDNDMSKKQKLYHNGDKNQRSRAPKGYWTAAEDQQLLAAVEAQKMRSRISWKEISKDVPGRSEKQCRERYMDYLNPSVDHSDWEPLEDDIILKGQKDLGNRWKDICKLITHKTRGAAAVKVRWHYLQRKLETNRKRSEQPNQPPKMFFIVNPNMTGQGGNLNYQQLLSGLNIPGQQQMDQGMQNSSAGNQQFLGLSESGLPPGAVVYICPPNGQGFPQGVDINSVGQPGSGEHGVGDKAFL